MPARKRLVLFVEGRGDPEAAVVLVRTLLNGLNCWDVLSLDNNPMRVGDYHRLVSNNFSHWVRFLGAARKRPNLGGVLLLLDGDVILPRAERFCAFQCAQRLAFQAKQEGAGSLFSLGIVFAVKEFETWLIGGLESLIDKPLEPGNRPGVKAGAVKPSGNLEERPRDAKGWLARHMAEGYKSTMDQLPLTKLLVEDLSPLRSLGLRSFSRLESALAELANAIRTGVNVATPVGHDETRE